VTRGQSGKILRALRRRYPDIKPDLRYTNRYQLAAAVLLSAQTTDRQVNAVTEELFRRYPGFPELARASRPQVERIIRSTGFFRTKAAHLIGLARAVMRRHGGTLPSSLDELIALPGIGRKSANVILSMGFNQPALAVDTHVARVARRIGYTDSRNPRDVERALTDLIPKQQWKLAHLLFIRHGRAICTARRPQCGSCPVSAWCASAGTIR